MPTYRQSGALAEPGGICISDLVHQLVRAARPDLHFTDLGDQRVKNIDRPIRV
jgi:adenylate cyclase